MSKTQGARAPDNNKRLAALEAGVSALAIALTANGVALEAGADPIEAAIMTVKGQAQAIAENLARIARLEEQPAGENATPGEIAAIARADKAEGELKAALEEIEELKADVEDAMSEKNRLANELAGADRGGGGAEAAAENEAEEAPAPVERTRPEAARDVGPNAGMYSAAELDELLTTGEVHGLELVFSNGDYEILSLQPIAIAPNELQPAEGRHVVVPPIFAKLLSTDAQEEIAGAALLLAGAQIAYCAFPDRLTLHPGGERRFERAIFF